MICSDNDIRHAIANGDLTIENMREEALQPASVDFRLGNAFWAYHRFLPASTIIDPTQSVMPLMKRLETTSLLLSPGEFILGHTIERVSLSSRMVGRVEGKSSLGRLGLTVHSTAGFIDPGNQKLSITLEMYNQAAYPIRLVAGMWICQLAFQYTITEAANPYGPHRGSRYYGDAEPVPSKVHERL